MRYFKYKDEFLFRIDKNDNKEWISLENASQISLTWSISTWPSSRIIGESKEIDPTEEELFLLLI
jgi:hypothetical protein